MNFAWIFIIPGNCFAVPFLEIFVNYKNDNDVSLQDF